MRKIAILTVLSLIVLNLTTSVVFSIAENEQTIRKADIHETANTKNMMIAVPFELTVETKEERIIVPVKSIEQLFVLVEDKYSPINILAPPFCLA